MLPQLRSPLSINFRRLLLLGILSTTIASFAENESPNFVKREIDSGYHNFSAIAGDFTGDGRLDIIAAEGRSDGVYLYAAPDFKKRTISHFAGGIHAVFFDIDGDGDDDPIFCRHRPGLIFWLEQPEADQAETLWNAHVIDSTEMAGPDGIHGLALADVDSDGNVDIVATGGLDDSLLYYNIPDNPKASWTRHYIAKGNAPALTHYVGTGDVNNDGRIDVATGGKGGNYFAWWEQPPTKDGEWIKHHLSDETGASHIEMVDINGDGVTDMLASRGHGDGLLWYEGPDFHKRFVDDSMHWPHAMDYGDLDNDGDIDVVAASATEGKGVAWFENDGKGQFTKHPLDVDQKSYQISIVDFDADGDQDILLSGQETENIVLFENR